MKPADRATLLVCTLKKSLSLLGEVKLRMLNTNMCYNLTILLNFSCIGSLVAAYFIDFGIDLYFCSELPFSPMQCTVHPYKMCNAKLAVTFIGGYNC